MKTIKRYPNRLLYDAEISNFVTGDDLRQYVRQGKEFCILDNSTGEDVTVKALSQVLIDDLSRSANKKPVIDTLRGFIALGGDFNMEILKKTILASIGVFDITKNKAEEIVDTLIKQGEIAKTKRADAILELLEKAEQSSKGLKDRVTKDIENAIEKMKVVKKKDLDELAKKVDDLSEQMKKIIEKLP